MKDNERDRQHIDELTNEPGAVGEEQLPQLDVRKSDKMPWEPAADRMKRKTNASKDGQEKYPFGAGL